MGSSIRKRVTFVNVALTVALVFVMTGGAYAASKYVITSTKQISPKVLKSLQGKTGKAGKAGAQGAQGPQGPAGPAGANGKDGAPGAPGGPGGSGESVTAKIVATTEKSKCGGLGGVEYTLAGKATLVCNGQTGFTSTLPSGKTEKGDWAMGGLSVSDPDLEGSAGIETAISFPIPLATAPANVHIISTVMLPGCSGSVADPEAEPGNLCIFIFKSKVGSVTLAASGGTGEFEKADPTGSILYDATSSAGQEMFAKGTWAVTAE